MEESMRKANKKPSQHTGTRALDWVANNQLLSDFTLAVDGGACFGEWTLPLSELFDEVYAFEPAPESRSIWFDKFKGTPNVVMFPYALMDRVHKVESFKPDNRKPMASRQVRPRRDGRVLAIPLDKMRLNRCTLLKLDLEGCEIPALLGASDTIARCKPLLIVEFNDKFDFHGTLDDLHKLIKNMGYEHVNTINVDRVYIPR